MFLAAWQLIALFSAVEVSSLIWRPKPLVILLLAQSARHKLYLLALVLRITLSGTDLSAMLKVLLWVRHRLCRASCCT
jgi:hypothetical protein